MKIMVMFPTAKEYYLKKQNIAEQEKFIQENYASPGTQIICCFPEELIGGGAIHLKQMKAGALSGFSFSILEPAIIKKALEAQENDFDAVVSSHTYDTGIEAARFVLRIPILGVGKASCHLALVLADRIGIIVPFDTIIPNAYRLLRSYGVSDSISSIVAANPPTGNGENQEEVFQCFENAGEKCLQNGAQIIIPFCGLFIPLTFSARALSERVGIMVIDTLAVGIGLAELMVRFNLTHSEKAYPSLVKTMSSEISSLYSEKL